jgi:predicted Zn-dependent protease
MKPFRLLVPLLAITPAVCSQTDPLVLKEVRHHLEAARTSVEQGKYGAAIAHAALVLVADEPRIAVRFQSVPPSRQAVCREALREAVTLWEESARPRVRFQLVSESESPDIVLQFQPDVRLRNEPVCGYVRWSRSMHTHGARILRGRTSAEIKIRERGMTGGPMSREAMRHAIMHELGHVLGLEDSRRVGDVMGPLDFRRPAPSPTAAEANAVRAVREQARDIRRTALRATADRALGK